MKRPNPALTLGFLASALFVLFIAGIAFGSVWIPFDRVILSLVRGLGFSGIPEDPARDAIVFLIRVPRVIAATMIGAVLALAGAVMQGVLRNPMADPGIIGVSSGAGLGAVLAIGTGLSVAHALFLPLAASVGALLAAAIIFGLTTRSGSRAVQTLILAGMAVSTFFGACTSLVLSFISKDDVQQFMFWSMGNLANVRWESLSLAGIPVLVGVLILPLFARDINVMMLGEEESRAVGLDMPRTRLLLLAIVAVCTASGVCIGGPIAFVGLIVPHMLRLVLGPDNRIILIASILGGACFLLACDLLSRTILGAREIQVGIVTSLLGAPYFIFLLLRSLRREPA